MQITTDLTNQERDWIQNRVCILLLDIIKESDDPRAIEIRELIEALTIN